MGIGEPTYRQRMTHHGELINYPLWSFISSFILYNNCQESNLINLRKTSKYGTAKLSQAAKCIPAKS